VWEQVDTVCGGRQQHPVQPSVHEELDR